MKRVALATVILSAIALTARAQPARENSSTPALQLRSIGGRVLADDTGDPIANARVALTTAVPGAPAVLTDHEGRFTLTAPPGRVTVAASKSGYSRREIPVTAADRSIEIRLCAARRSPAASSTSAAIRSWAPGSSWRRHLRLAGRIFRRDRDY